MSSFLSAPLFLGPPAKGLSVDFSILTFELELLGQERQVECRDEVKSGTNEARDQRRDEVKPETNEVRDQRRDEVKREINVVRDQRSTGSHEEGKGHEQNRRGAVFISLCILIYLMRDPARKYGIAIRRSSIY
jgi:hypothetical protein